MKHWLIHVTNSKDYEFKDRLPMIKDLNPIIRRLGVGGLKEAKEFVYGEESLRVTSPCQAARIIAFCDECGLSIRIKTITTRDITHLEFKRLEEG